MAGQDVFGGGGRAAVVEIQTRPPAARTKHDQEKGAHQLMGFFGIGGF